MAKRSSVTMMRETERKYEAVEDWELVDPAGLLGFATGTGPEEQELAAVYFDTADLRLIREGITLRRREGGSDAGWHLKLPAGTDSRQELRLPLGGNARRPPAELVGLTRVYTRGAALAPVAELTTRRRRWVLAEPGGQAIAELVDDQVTARSMGAQTTTVSWREVEVELAEHAQAKVLDRIERRLLQTGAQRAGSSSKLGRLLAERTPAAGSPAQAKRARSAGDVVLAYLAAQVAQLRRYDPLVRQDAPDAVHQMRVAELPKSVRRAYRRVESRMADADRQSPGPQRDVALHETRKAAKRLRYATEAVKPAIGKPATRLRKRLKAVQQVLGEHQDTAVSRPVLRELAAQAHLEGGNGFTYGLMYATEATRAEHAENNLPSTWKQMRRPKNTAWLNA